MKQTLIKSACLMAVFAGLCPAPIDPSIALHAGDYTPVDIGASIERATRIAEEQERLKRLKLQNEALAEKLKAEQQPKAEAAIQPNSQSSPQTQVDMRSIMNAQAFQSAGLQRLSTDELAYLNRWMSGFLPAFAKNVVDLVKQSQSAPSAVESHIDGEFEGWSGNNIWKLDNGQIWQQSGYAYTYHYAYHPSVLIYADGPVYKMKIDGADDTISVRRLK